MTDRHVEASRKAVASEDRGEPDTEIELSASHSEDGRGRRVTRRKISVAAVLLAMSLVVLDAGMTTVALPTLALALRTTSAATVLVITAYQAALVMALLPCAALGERLGHRRVFCVGVTIFTCASGLCALSPSLAWLIVARFVQGLGGAAILALGVALLRDTMPSNRISAAIGWNALTVAIASAASPAAGALILASSSWHWLYLVNLPLGAVVLFAARALPDPRPSLQSIDPVSMGLNGCAFAMLVIGAELLLARPALAALLIAGSVIAMGALLRRETPKATPMIPLDLLAMRPFRLSVIASICCFIGQTAGMVALPFYLQHVLGQTPVMAGLYMTVWPLSIAITAAIIVPMTNRIPSALLCAIGGGTLAIGLGAAALWPLDEEPRLLVAFAVLCGLGFGLFQLPNNRTLFLSAPLARSGAAGGLQGTARVVGQTGGTVLMSLLLANLSIDIAPRIGLGIGAILALVAGLISAMRTAGQELRGMPTAIDWDPCK